MSLSIIITSIRAIKALEQHWYKRFCFLIIMKPKSFEIVEGTTKSIFIN